LAQLDKHLKKVSRLEEASLTVSRPIAAPGLAGVFLLVVLVFAISATASGPLSFYVVAATVISGYMALYVGANDVANNVGPAVGGRALTLAAALAIAAVFEAAGALIAGGDVVTTISKDIIRPQPDMAALEFILLMTAGILASAMWIHLATYLGAPVSTTHSVVGGVLGSGIAASGIDAVSWPMIGAIAASWVISPMMGGVLAAALYWMVRTLIIDRPSPYESARRWLPVIVAAMAGVFAVYLTTKGLSRVWKPSDGTLLTIGLAAFLVAAALSRPWVRSHSIMAARKGRPVTVLFTLPLIGAAALLCFAHGANDVANAIGPLAAIVAAAGTGVAAPREVALPLWALVIGAAGISLGLGLFGPTVIRTVGQKITKMNPSRAYCVALSAATTVLLASALGLPVSSTHVTVGGVFGIGLLREAITNKGIPNPAVRPRTRFLRISALNATPEEALLRTRKRERRKLVRRQYGLSIGAAWVITVPATATIAVILYALMVAASGV
jgi:inorganic phosphate transporter, PiT family